MESLRQAFESIGESPRRVAASAMGVFWGAAAIVLMLAWGSGFVDYMKEEFGRFGRGGVFIGPGITSSGFPGYRPGVRVQVSRADAARIERDHPERVEAVMAEHLSQERLLVEARGRVRRLDLIATDPRFPYYRRFELAAGRFFDATDLERRRPVAVLGWDAASELFDSTEAGIGSTLRIDGEPFELIGVFARKDGRQYNNTNRPENRLLVLPSSSAEARLGYDRDRIARLLAFPKPGVSGKDVVDSVLSTLASRRGFHPEDGDAVRWFDTTDTMSVFDLMHVGFSVFLGLAGTVTLLVGGIGIANYHLALLSERTVEIGVAKALGARNAVLMRQAVLEAGLVAGGASFAGVALGLLGCAALTWLAPADMFPVPVISLTVLVITALALTGVGVIAALVPALRVRRMEISAALREG
jgi:putative ABC transport system permease protein